MPISIAQIRAARALIGWSQDRLARAAGLSGPTIRRFETDQGIRVSDVSRDGIVRALEAAGVEFTNGDQPGVRKKRSATRPDSISSDDLNASNDD